MALRYFFNEDEFGGVVRGLDDTGEHFWAGVMQCAAPLVLAATLASAIATTQVAAATATPADEVIASLAPDEDYAPTVLNIPLWHTAWYAGTAAPVAPVISDDDTWQAFFTPPQDCTFYMVAPWAWGHGADDLSLLGNTIAPPEEDYWQNPVPLPPLLFAYPQPWALDYQIEIPTIGPPEEEFWQNPTPPVTLSYAPLWPWALDPQDEISVPGQPDEDFWNSGVAPVPVILLWTPQWAYDPQDEQAFGLVGPPAPIAVALLLVNPFAVTSNLVMPIAVTPINVIGPN